MKKINRLKMLMEQFPKAKVVVNTSKFADRPPQLFGKNRIGTMARKRGKRYYPIRAFHIVVGIEWLQQNTRKEEFVTFVGERLKGRIVFQDLLLPKK